MHNLRTSIRHGFTIVELLIVIVVIAILATISTVVFGGIRERALQSSVKTSLNDTVRRLEVDKATRGAYANNLNELENSTMSNSGGVRYQYTGGGADYCLTATLQVHSFYRCSSHGEPQKGVYAEHTDPNFTADSTQVVHTQIDTIALTTDKGGNQQSIPIDFDLKPDDFVFLLFNIKYNTTLSIEKSDSTPVPRIFHGDMGASGYQQTMAYTSSGFTGRQTLTANVCWRYCATNAGWDAEAVYIAYVIRGLGNNPIVSTTNTEYGVKFGANTLVSPQVQSLRTGEVAIFTNTHYAINLPTLQDNSTPRQTWSTDSLRSHPRDHASANSLTALHLVATEDITVGHHLTTSSASNNYVATALFTIKRRD